MLRDKTKDGTTVITGFMVDTDDPVYKEFNHASQNSGATTGWVRQTGGAFAIDEDGYYLVTISEGFGTGTGAAGRRGVGVGDAAGSGPYGQFQDIRTNQSNSSGSISTAWVAWLTAGTSMSPWRYTDVVNNYGAGVGYLNATKLVAGKKGDKGDAATITVNSTVTGAPGSAATVVNVGTAAAADLVFTIPRGDVGAQGIKGTRYGTTNTWVLGSSTNVLVAFPDGLGAPRVGDFVVGTNGFDPGQVTIVTNVVDATHADLATTYAGATYPNVRGPQGPAGSTTITLNNLTITTDLNTLTETGFYELINNNATSNAPGGYTNGFLTVTGTGNNTTQMFQTLDGKRFYHRSRNAGTWTAWRELASAVRRISHARRTANTVLVAATGTRLTGWNTEDYSDPMATLSTDGYTINEAGIYEVKYALQVASTATARRVFWSIGHGAAFGVTYDTALASLVDITTPAAAASPAGECDAIFTLAVGDKVWGMVQSTIADTIGPAFSKLQLKKVG